MVRPMCWVSTCLGTRFLVFDQSLRRSSESSSKSSFLIDSKATTQTANLSQVSLDPSNPDQKSYVWNISLRDESEIDYSSGFYYRAYSSATVDAKSGKVIHFNANTREYTNEKDAKASVKLSESEGQKKAEAFLNYLILHPKR